MQNLRVEDSNYLTFFDSGGNAHLIDGQLARQLELKLISSKSIALGVIGGESIRTEYGVCPKCSKCLTCKKSQRSTAVSLQEAWEQVIIEESVKICEDNNTGCTWYL